jgi:hypothetical protein
MKKVKIMLLALSVVAVVGGALAFKAKDLIQLKCGPAIDNCPTLVTVNWKLTTDADHRFQDTYCTIKTGDPENCTYVTNE